MFDTNASQCLQVQLTSKFKACNQIFEAVRFVHETYGATMLKRVIGPSSAMAGFAIVHSVRQYSAQCNIENGTCKISFNWCLSNEPSDKLQGCIQSQIENALLSTYSVNAATCICKLWGKYEATSDILMRDYSFKLKFIVTMPPIIMASSNDEDIASRLQQHCNYGIDNIFADEVGKILANQEESTLCDILRDAFYIVELRHNSSLAEGQGMVQSQGFGAPLVVQYNLIQNVGIPQQVYAALVAAINAPLVK